MRPTQQREIHDRDFPTFEDLGSPDRVMNYLLLRPVTVVSEENLT